MQPVDPSTAATFPAAHELQLPWPVLSWYLPASQPLHDDAAVPDTLPAVQSSQLLAPALLACVPESQFVHVDDRSADFVPGSQSLHDDAALPLHFPAPQSLQCSDEVVLCEPALQAVHVVAEAWFRRERRQCVGGARPFLREAQCSVGP